MCTLLYVYKRRHKSKQALQKNRSTCNERGKTDQLAAKGKKSTHNFRKSFNKIQENGSFRVFMREVLFFYVTVATQCRC